MKLLVWLDLSPFFYFSALGLGYKGSDYMQYLDMFYVSQLSYVLIADPCIFCLIDYLPMKEYQEHMVVG